jgi:hypothetical protein
MTVESLAAGATHRGGSLRSRLGGAGVVLAAALLSACSGGSGADVQQNPGIPTQGVTSNYNGPPPATEDVQSFKINLWDNIQANNRCGTCHSDTGGQAPMFARRDDINLAYAAANGVVTLPSPKDSRMVGKVGGGHNCWLASNAACGDILTTWITNWAGDTLRPLRARSSSSRRCSATRARARTSRPTKASVLADGLSGARAVLLGLSRVFHGAQAAAVLRRRPAERPRRGRVAYEAAKAKMNLEDPSISRFVLRLRNESHNCWTTSCTNDANVMQAAIQAFSNGVVPTSVDPALFTSKATTLYEGTIASGGNRYEANVVALYEFKRGKTAARRSRAHAPLRTTRAASIRPWTSRCPVTCNGSAAGA